MRRVELLSPAKNVDVAIAAINNGADAVYIGGPAFGARKAVGNSLEDIEKAVKEAEQYAAEDAKVKEKVEVRNQADQMVYQSEKTLGEVGDKIPADEKSKVQAGIDKLKETLKGDDTDAIKAATEELTQLFYAMSEKLYQQANPQGAQGAGPDMGGAQGGAQTGPDGQQYYDADYKVVDDDENKK